MKKAALLLALVIAAMGMSTAMAHDESNEAHRTCSAPFMRGTDSSGLSYNGLCVQDVGTVRVGSDSNDNFFIAVDGAKEMGGESGGPETWGDGYMIITIDRDGDVHGYCSGNGSYENGRQADDEFGADCGAQP